MIRKLKFFIAFVFIVQLFVQPSQAEWGQWDPNFANGSPSLLSATDLYPSSVAIQPDGKILVTGYKLSPLGSRQFFLLRYNSTGGLDASFGRNGYADFRVPQLPPIRRLNSTSGEKIAILPDGRIAVAGRANGDYAVWRFSSSGHGDTGFGIGGFQAMTNYPADGPVAIDVQDESLILGVVRSSNAVLLRLKRNGRIDTTFGDRGEVETVIYGPTFSMFVESDSGKITVGGWNGVNFGRMRAERKMPDGEDDPSFFADHQYSIPGGPQHMLRLSNQKYVFQTFQPTAPGFPPANSGLLGLDMFGGLETRFAFHIDDGTTNYAPQVLAEQSDGQVIVSGFGHMYRINNDLDPRTLDLCDCGYSFVPFSNKTPAVLQRDNKMVYAGRLNVEGNLGLIRTLPYISVAQ
ncbi:MAG: delta-60 repeat domain-containing protein [Pyrinomonadaceae bacterium]